MPMPQGPGEIVAAADSSLHDLLAIWDAQGMQRLRASAIANGADPQVFAGAAAETQVTALQALQANREIVQLLTGWRWIAMRDARSEGASWSQIGDALGMSKQGAYDFYRNAIERQERYAADFHDTAAARAALVTADLPAGCTCTIDYRDTRDEQRTLDHDCTVHSGRDT